ncbi:hypothetical protein COBT_001866 [Conglomerata obtusa]
MNSFSTCEEYLKSLLIRTQTLLGDCVIYFPKIVGQGILVNMYTYINNFSQNMNIELEIYIAGFFKFEENALKILQESNIVDVMIQDINNKSNINNNTYDNKSAPQQTPNFNWTYFPSLDPMSDFSTNLTANN